MYKTSLWVVPLSVSVPLRSVSNCLVLLFATTSLTSDRVMSPNGSFSTVLNTFVLEWGQGMVLSWGGGGIRNCALFWKGGVIPPISEACTGDVEAAYSKFECLGYPRGQRKTSMFSFYATIPIGQFPSRGGTPYITYTGMCRPKGSWFWSSWFRTGYPFQRRFLERGLIFRTHESSPLL